LKYSLKSSDKLRLKSDFDFVRANGVKYISRICVLAAAPSRDGALRGGVICGRKFSVKAVVRNRARRLLWESVRLLKPYLRAAHFVMIPRAGIKELRQQEVQVQLEKLFKKAGIWEDGGDTSVRRDLPS